MAGTCGAPSTKLPKDSPRGIKDVEFGRTCGVLLVVTEICSGIYPGEIMDVEVERMCRVFLLFAEICSGIYPGELRTRRLRPNCLGIDPGNSDVGGRQESMCHGVVRVGHKSGSPGFDGWQLLLPNH
jgi:hypothetical protein